MGSKCGKGKPKQGSGEIFGRWICYRTGPERNQRVNCEEVSSKFRIMGFVITYDTNSP